MTLAYRHRVKRFRRQRVEINFLQGLPQTMQIHGIVHPSFAAGNRISVNAPAAMTLYSWDQQNRLTQVEPVGSPVTMLYDGLGRRTEKKTNTTTVQYLYDFERLLAETDGTGTTEREYTQTTDQYGDLLSAYGSGEALDGDDTVRVRRVEDTRRMEPVYSIEVEGDFCYRIGEQGVLVHNASAGDKPTPPSGSNNCDSTVTTAPATEYS